MKKIGIIIAMLGLGFVYYKYVFNQCERPSIMVVQSLKMACLNDLIQDPEKLFKDTCLILNEREDCDPNQFSDEEVESGIKKLLVKCINEELDRQSLCTIKGL